MENSTKLLLRWLSIDTILLYVHLGRFFRAEASEEYLGVHAYKEWKNPDFQVYNQA